jgi:hypothetical protein
MAVRREFLDGNVHSYNEGHPADTVAILVSDALLIMRGGIVEVESHTSGQVVRVVEGQVSVETPSSAGKQVLVKAGQGLEIRTGMLNTRILLEHCSARKR